MAKRYKYKLYKECNDTDKEHRNDIRKSLNSSERQRGKSEAMSAQKDFELYYDKAFINNLRRNMEYELADKCWKKEVTDPTRFISVILKKLGMGWHNLHKCTCPRPEKLSDIEVLHRSGF